MKSYVPFYRRPLSRGAVVLLVVGIALVVAIRVFGTGKRDTQRKAVVRAEAAALDLMHAMSDDPRQEQWSEATTLNDVMGKENWTLVGYKSREVVLQVRGVYPTYNGTTFDFDSDRLFRPVRITVVDMSQQTFTSDAEPVPNWWEFWR